MLRLEQDRLASRNVPLGRPNAPGLGPTVVAFRPVGATPRSAFRPLGEAGASHSNAVGAHIIPLQPRRRAPPARSTRPMSPVGGRYASVGAGQPRQPVTPEDDHRHRMLENLVVFVWLGTLMSVAFFVFSRLLGI